MRLAGYKTIAIRPRNSQSAAFSYDFRNQRAGANVAAFVIVHIFATAHVVRIQSDARQPELELRSIAA